MYLLLISLLTSAAQAQTHSRLLPLFQEAVRTWQRPEKVVSPAVSVIHGVLDRGQWRRPWLESFLLLPPKSLPKGIAPTKRQLEWPAVALHVVRLDVVKTSDDWMKDDVYCYFLVTDGALPFGKVTQTYRGLSAGESFHFAPEDRVLFPMTRELAQPRGALVVDYGLIESDGDDVRELHRLTGVIAELALAVYAVLEPTEAAQWGSLRQEVVALTQALVSLNHDDRLATGTLVIDAQAARDLLGDAGLATIQRVHQNNHFFDKWRYRLVWRLMR